MKLCKKCGLLKPDELFGVDKSRKDNRAPYCRECRTKFEASRKKDGKRNYKKKPPTKEKRQEYMRSCRYRLSKDEYNKILNGQNGLCCICSNEMQNPHVDHNHESGQVRGLLCKTCNFALGLFKDDIELLQSAINYLKRTKDVETHVASLSS